MLAMERKIGEIFEFGGEWLQCVEQPKKYDKTVCAICDFQGNGNCELDRCSETYRSDKKSVIFKKLEKVGEPYMLEDKKFQKYRVFHTPYIYNKIDYSWQSFADPYYISLEIKQTKEDMEDLDKIKVRDYTKVEELNVMEEKKLNLKPFDIQKAREGKPVCTRDGRKARIICFDRIDAKPILALVRSTDGKGEDVFDYFVSGKRLANALESDLDLMMLHEKKEGWINIYNADTTFYYVDGRVFETKDEAVKEAKEEVEKEQREKNEYIDTIRVEWEE